MSESLFAHEPAVRFAAFAGIFALLALWEAAAPRRRLAFGRRRRWPSNIGIVIVDTALLRLVLPTALVGFALTAEARGWGLFNNTDLPAWAELIGAVVLLDLAIYFQHVLFHAVPALWRLHRMHHADLDFDVTTGIRFHPFEILLSAVIKRAVIAALGAPALGVLIFEILLNGTSLFNHGNVRMPAGVDGILRWFVVTPDMHRVHHSAIRRETNSNFGFNFPWWDRILGTYRAQPEAGHTAMTIGIEQFREADELRLDKLLTQPFRGPAVTYPIGRSREDG